MMKILVLFSKKPEHSLQNFWTKMSQM